MFSVGTVCRYYDYFLVKVTGDILYKRHTVSDSIIESVLLTVLVVFILGTIKNIVAKRDFSAFVVAFEIYYDFCILDYLGLRHNIQIPIAQHTCNIIGNF